jgi:hypothetical protein
VPFAILIDETTQLPCRRFELDQSKCRVTPSADADQLRDPSGLSGPFHRRKACAPVRDDIGDEIGRERVDTTKPSLQHIKGLVFGSNNMTTISRDQRPYTTTHPQDGVKGHKKSRWSQEPKIEMEPGAGKLEFHKCVVGN